MLTTSADVRAQRAPEIGRPFIVAPIFTVSGHGASAEQASALASALDIDAKLLQGDGSLVYVDPDRLHFAPTVPLNDPRTDERRTDEHGHPITREALRLSALERMKVVSDGEAISRARNALRRAGLTPEGAAPSVAHTKLDVHNGDGSLKVSAALDTTVTFNTSLMGIPLRGPGAKMPLHLRRRGQDRAGAIRLA